MGVKLKNLREREAAREKRRKRKDELSTLKAVETRAKIKEANKFRELFGDGFDKWREKWPLDVVDDYGDIVDRISLTRTQLVNETRDETGYNTTAPALFVKHRFLSFPSTYSPWDKYTNHGKKATGEYRFRLRDDTMPGASDDEDEPPRHYNCRSSFETIEEEPEETDSKPMSIADLRKRFSRE